MYVPLPTAAAAAPYLRGIWQKGLEANKMWEKLKKQHFVSQIFSWKFHEDFFPISSLELLTAYMSLIIDKESTVVR